MRRASLKDQQVWSVTSIDTRRRKQLESFGRRATRSDMQDQLDTFEIESGLPERSKHVGLDCSELDGHHRVATLMMANTNSRCTYGFLGSMKKCTTCRSTFKTEESFPGSTRLITGTRRTSLLIEKLKSFEEGEGTVLDQSIVMFMSGIKHGVIAARLSR